MSFGDILDQWENKQKKEQSSQASQSETTHDLLLNWLDRNPVEEKEESRAYCRENGNRTAAERRKYLRELKPQAELDLHGYTIEEAVTALDWFIKDCKKKRKQKALIIHGKGKHTAGEPVLKREVRRYLEASPLTGEMGEPDRLMGGSGAVWVIIR